MLECGSNSRTRSACSDAWYKPFHLGCVQLRLCPYRRITEELTEVQQYKESFGVRQVRVSGLGAEGTQMERPTFLELIR